MFFFFIGGLEQQARQVVKTGAGKCISCGFPADLVEYEKVLKLFFVPVWRWPGKHPLMHCKSCNLFFPSVVDTITRTRCCHMCDRQVDPSFRFCPFCGASL